MLHARVKPRIGGAALTVVMEMKEPDPGAALPRAIGTVSLSAHRRGPATVIGRLFQKGSSRALLPRTFEPGLTAVLLNTAGGITGGDLFSTEASAGQGADLTLATQTAERAYRALPGGVGRVSTRLSGAAGATLRWLPQETILFDGAALTRRLSVDLAGDATFLAVEPVILGRAAMGETLGDLRLSDQWRVRRDGRLIYADALRLHGNPEALTGTAATLSGHRAFAQILYAAPDAARHLDPLRALLPAGGASLIRPGVLSARLTAPDGFDLRRALIPALERLAAAPLPKVWKM